MNVRFYVVQILRIQKRWPLGDGLWPDFGGNIAQSRPAVNNKLPSLLISLSTATFAKNLKDVTVGIYSPECGFGEGKISG